MKISIGIIAHNEEDDIRNILGDLRDQSIFDRAGCEADVFVIANGCSDRTAEISDEVFAADYRRANMTCRTVSLEIPSKTNAWNAFVHDIQPGDCDYTVLVDADIRISQTDLLERLIDYLARHADTAVTLGRSAKIFPNASSLNLIRHLRRLFSGSVSRGNSAISSAFCGQLYCARTSEIRKIVLPIGFLCQDGFLWAMFLTLGLTGPQRFERIRMLPGCFHLDPDYDTLDGLFRYEKRQAIGTAIFALVYAEMNGMPASLEARMAEIGRRNIEDPDWVRRLIEKAAGRRGAIVSMRYRLRSLRHLAEKRGARVLLAAALTPFVLVFDMIVCWRAERELRTGSFGTLRGNAGKFKIR